MGLTSEGHVKITNELISEVRDGPGLREVSRVIEDAMGEARWQGCGNWDQARYAAWLLRERLGIEYVPEVEEGE